MKLRNNPNKNVVRAANRFKEWDYAFLLEIEKEAFKRMLDQMENHSHFENAHIYASRLRTIIGLLDIILGNNEVIKMVEKKPQGDKSFGKWLMEDHDWELTRHVNIRNWKRFRVDDDDVEETDFFKTALFASMVYEEKAWRLYNRMREQYMRHFWD